MKKLVFLIALISLSINLSAQKEEEGKIIREIISLEVERPKPANVNPDVPDTLPPTMAAPEAEVLKRAENWYKLKHIKYEKSSGATAGKTIACKATFIFKQKETPSTPSPLENTLFAFNKEVLKVCFAFFSNTIEQPNGK